MYLFRRKDSAILEIMLRQKKAIESYRNINRKNTTANPSLTKTQRLLNIQIFLIKLLANH